MFFFSPGRNNIQYLNSLLAKLAYTESRSNTTASTSKTLLIFRISTTTTILQLQKKESILNLLQLLQLHQSSQTHKILAHTRGENYFFWRKEAARNFEWKLLIGSTSDILVYIFINFYQTKGRRRGCDTRKYLVAL